MYSPEHRFVRTPTGTQAFDDSSTITLEERKVLGAARRPIRFDALEEAVETEGNDLPVLLATLVRRGWITHLEERVAQEEETLDPDAYLEQLVQQHAPAPLPFDTLHTSSEEGVPYEDAPWHAALEDELDVPVEAPARPSPSSSDEEFDLDFDKALPPPTPEESEALLLAMGVIGKERGTQAGTVVPLHPEEEWTGEGGIEALMAALGRPGSPEVTVPSYENERRTSPVTMDRPSDFKGDSERENVAREAKPSPDGGATPARRSLFSASLAAASSKVQQREEAKQKIRDKQHQEEVARAEREHQREVDRSYEAVDRVRTLNVLGQRLTEKKRKLDQNSD